MLVDCDPDHLLIDPKLVEALLTERTRAIVAVDLYGQMAPFDQIHDVVDGRDVLVYEDAAQSQGAARHGQPIGASAIAAATSYYPGKNLGAYGDAGAIVTDDDDLASAARAIGNHGGTKKYEHGLIGFNSRLDALQAVVLRAKLARLTAVLHGARGDPSRVPPLPREPAPRALRSRRHARAAPAARARTPQAVSPPPDRPPGARRTLRYTARRPRIRRREGSAT